MAALCGSTTGDWRLELLNLSFAEKDSSSTCGPGACPPLPCTPPQAGQLRGRPSVEAAGGPGDFAHRPSYPAWPCFAAGLNLHCAQLEATRQPRGARPGSAPSLKSRAGTPARVSSRLLPACADPKPSDCASRKDQASRLLPAKGRGQGPLWGVTGARAG